MSFTKHGSIFTITDSNRIKTASDWSDIIALTSNKKTSTAEGIKIHKNLTTNEQNNVVCSIDVDNYIYIHTTIMAAVDVEPNSDYWITKETEKYINTNGDAWERSVLLNDYSTFVQNGVVYVEHDQNPERAKGKVLDVPASDLARKELGNVVAANIVLLGKAVGAGLVPLSKKFMFAAMKELLHDNVLEATKKIFKVCYILK